MAVWWLNPLRWRQVDRLARRAAKGPVGESWRWSSADDVPMLLQIMAGKRRRPAARARTAVETLWESGRVHQEWIWTSIWSLATMISWSSNVINVAPAVVEFLLGPDPDAPHEPRVRLVRGLSIANPSLLGTRGNAATEILAMALRTRESGTRRAFARILTRTDHPVLLTVLQDAFVQGLERNGGATPARLTQLVLANPHLPHVPAGRLGPQHADLAVLMAVRDRLDLLDRFDGQTAVATLLRYLTHQSSPPTVLAACRRALRSFGPGPLRQAVCLRAMEPDAEQEAVDAAVDSGYLPADPDAEPLFLALTRQWERFAQVDPDGERLYAYRLSSAFTHRKRARHTVEAFLRITGRAPAVVWDASRRALRDVGPGPAREHLCALALRHDKAALRVVKDAGHLPSKVKTVPAFLFLTRQWDRYDSADPDGSRLRAYAEALERDDPLRDRLRLIANRAARPAPCEPARYPQYEPSR